MSEQFGFDFCDAAARAFALDEVGTWLYPEHTVEQYRVMFAKGTEAIKRIAGPARPLFAHGLMLASAELEKMVERCGEDKEPRRIWRVTCDPTDDEFDAFVAHSRAMVSSAFDGIEYKVRDENGYVVAAMYARDVGTLIARQWSETNRAIDFRPWRDSFFLESYRDGIQAIKAPYSTWGRAYCAEKLANSNDGIASVPTFVINGREYINDGGFSRGSHRECEAGRSPRLLIGKERRSATAAKFARGITAVSNVAIGAVSWCACAVSFACWTVSSRSTIRRRPIRFGRRTKLTMRRRMTKPTSTTRKHLRRKKLPPELGN